MKTPFFLAALSIAGIVASSAAAQSITIILLDGRTAKPIKRSWLNLWTKEKGPALPLAFDEVGKGKFNLQTTAPTSSAANSRTLEYSDTLSIQLGYQPCWEKTLKAPQFARYSFSTQEILDSGLAQANNCGKQTVAVHPGELILYVKPLTFWQAMRD
jgi:hypothetical protein